MSGSWKSSSSSAPLGTPSSASAPLACDKSCSDPAAPEEPSSTPEADREEAAADLLLLREPVAWSLLTMEPSKSSNGMSSGLSPPATESSNPWASRSDMSSENASMCEDDS